MRILILNQVFPPDRVSSADIFADLAKDLRDRGHCVMALTTIPHYNPDPDLSRKQPLRPLWPPFLWTSTYENIPVYHAFMPPKSPHLWSRVLGWLGFHAISIAASILYVRRTDVILAVSPPLSLGIVGWVLARFLRGKYIYNVQEMYPDLAIVIGAIRNRAVIRLLYAMESLVYHKAAGVTTIGETMAGMLLAKGVIPSKVQVIPNPAEVDKHELPAKDNRFSRRYCIENKFVVTYAGNIGRAQGLTTFVDAAAHLQLVEDIQFMLIGSGTERASLNERIQRLQLRNIHSLPYQPNETMPEIMAASDLCLVPLVAGIGNCALPSKVYRIMAAARPVLAVADRDSELARLVERVDCGWVTPPGSPRLLAETVASVRQKPVEAQEKGLRGQRFVLEHQSRQSIADRYEALFITVTGCQ